MNCIDAVESMAKALLDKFLDVSSAYRLDLSEYIRNVKVVIDTVVLFVKDNPEISETPELIRDILYDFAKKNWLAHLETGIEPDEETGGSRDLDYQAYCYDYLYVHGNYPRWPIMHLEIKVACWLVSWIELLSIVVNYTKKENPQMTKSDDEALKIEIDEIMSDVDRIMDKVAQVIPENAKENNGQEGPDRVS